MLGRLVANRTSLVRIFVDFIEALSTQRVSFIDGLKRFRALDTDMLALGANGIYVSMILTRLELVGTLSANSVARPELQRRCIDTEFHLDVAILTDSCLVKRKMVRALPALLMMFKLPRLFVAVKLTQAVVQKVTFRFTDLAFSRSVGS